MDGCGERLHELGRSDGDYHTDDHDRAAESLHFAQIEFGKNVRQFMREHGDAALKAINGGKG